MLLNDPRRNSAADLRPPAGALAPRPIRRPRRDQHARADEPVVLVPCSTGSPRQWRALVDDLAGFEAVCVELVGHGDCGPGGVAGHVSLDDEVENLAETVDDRAPIHLVGHSYGGAVALTFAMRFPERVRSLALFEPSCFHLLRWAAPEGDAALSEIAMLADAVAGAVSSGDRDAAMAMFIDYWSGPGAWESMTESARRRIVGLAPLVVDHFRSLLGNDTRIDAYRRLTVPTLILGGTRSPRPARAVARRLAEALPDARHRTIRDAGHMAPVTHAADVNSHVVAHVASHRHPSTAEAGGVF